MQTFCTIILYDVWASFNQLSHCCRHIMYVFISIYRQNTMRLYHYYIIVAQRCRCQRSSTFSQPVSFTLDSSKFYYYIIVLIRNIICYIYYIVFCYYCCSQYSYIRIEQLTRECAYNSNNNKAFSHRVKRESANKLRKNPEKCFCCIYSWINVTYTYLFIIFVV